MLNRKLIKFCVYPTIAEHLYPHSVGRLLSLSNIRFHIQLGKHTRKFISISNVTYDRVKQPSGQCTSVFLHKPRRKSLIKQIQLNRLISTEIIFLFTDSKIQSTHFRWYTTSNKLFPAYRTHSMPLLNQQTIQIYLSYSSVHAEKS